MNKTAAVLAVVCVLSAAASAAADMPRVTSYEIDLTFEAEDPRIVARTDITFVPGTVPSDTLTFYLHGELWVDEARLEGHPVEIEQDLVFYSADYSSVARRCRIDLTTRHAAESLSVTYSGKLNPSVSQAPSNYMRVDSDGIFLRSYGYSIWFPTFLEADEDTYPVDSVVTVRTPVGFLAVVTGERISDEIVGATRVSRWRTEQNDLFNLQLTARRFEFQKESETYLYFLRDAASRSAADEILGFTRELKQFYQTNYSGDAAGAQLHVVQMPRFGDISSGNMVGISDRVWRDFEQASYSGRTLAHELVHPHVQLAVPRDGEFYALVIEGFPSYFHLPAMASLIGEDWYDSYIEANLEGYVERRRTGLDRRGNPLPPEKPLLEMTADDIGTYKDRFVLSDRVRLFFDWLRRRMGSEDFNRFTRELFSRQSLDFESFTALTEKHLPGSTEGVTLWLRTTEFPDRFKPRLNSPSNEE
ncbi:MAG: hypothetical protein P8127_03625 [Acidobacteriota bacterium]|jgi:hypothetical protein